MSDTANNKCSVQLLNRVGRGGKCDAYEWADGFCYRHHPVQRLAILKRQIVQHQEEVANLLSDIDSIKSIL